MKRWALSALLLIFAISIFMRVYPLTHYTIWGSDTGEYYYLTQRLVNDGAISFSYNGWGFGYPYFPGMFILVGGFQLISGIDLLNLMLYLTPIIASMIIFPIFLISKKMFADERAALIAAGILGLTFPHVFPTSHPMPGAIGDLIALVCLWLFIEARDYRKYVLPLIFLTFVLIITHHLSTYFLLISVIFIVFLREVLQRHSDMKTTKLDSFYILFLLTSTILYWTLIAIPFRDKIMSTAFDIEFSYIILLIYVCILFIPLVVWTRRKILWQYLPKFPTHCVVLALFGVALVGIFSAVFALTFTKVPSTDIAIDKSVLVLLSPIFFVMAFTIVGTKFSRFYKNGIYIYAWLGAIALSFIFMSVINNRVIMPYRHFQYMFEPMAILIGLGIVKFYEYWSRDCSSLKKAAAIAGMVLLITVSTFSAYPARGVMGGFEEGTTETELYSVYWAKINIEKPATVATDHRMSSMIFGFADINASWDYADRVLHGKNFTEAEWQINSCKAPSGVKSIDYVLLSNAIKEGVALLQWEPAEQLSSDAVEKFNNEPFIKIYDSGEVQVYRI